MHHITNNKIFDVDTYGSCKDKTVTEALISLQSIFEYCRILKQNMGMLFNDADGCYIQIPPNLAEIAKRQVGCPKNIAQAHTQSQRKMKHYIKTGSGISDGYIQFVPILQMLMISGVVTMLLGLIGGVGQGSGGSPIIWFAALLIMIQAYKATHEGIKIVNAITLEKVCFWIVSNVDNNTIVCKLQLETKIPELLSELGKAFFNETDYSNTHGIH